MGSSVVVLLFLHGRRMVRRRLQGLRPERSGSVCNLARVCRIHVLPCTGYEKETEWAYPSLPERTRSVQVTVRHKPSSFCIEHVASTQACVQLLLYPPFSGVLLFQCAVRVGVCTFVGMNTMVAEIMFQFVDVLLLTFMNCKLIIT